MKYNDDTEFRVHITICRQRYGTNRILNPPERLYQRDIRKENLDKWEWYFDYLVALFKCRYPMDKIRLYHSYYKKVISSNRKFETPKVQLIIARSWLTRAEKALKAYEQKALASLFSDLNNDERYQKLLKKVEEKRTKVEMMEKEVAEITDISKIPLPF